jgi:hypothetical protein
MSSLSELQTRTYQDPSVVGCLTPLFFSDLRAVLPPRTNLQCSFAIHPENIRFIHAQITNKNKPIILNYQPTEQQLAVASRLIAIASSMLDVGEEFTSAFVSLRRKNSAFWRQNREVRWHRDSIKEGGTAVLCTDGEPTLFKTGTITAPQALFKSRLYEASCEIASYLETTAAQPFELIQFNEDDVHSTPTGKFKDRGFVRVIYER